MSTHLSLNLFNELRKRSNARLWRACYCFICKRFINLITKELKCYMVILYGLKLHSL